MINSWIRYLFMRWVSSSPSSWSCSTFHVNAHIFMPMLMFMLMFLLMSYSMRQSLNLREATRRATFRFWVSYPNELLRLEGVSLAGTVNQNPTEAQPSPLFIHSSRQLVNIVNIVLACLCSTASVSSVCCRSSVFSLPSHQVKQWLVEQRG